MKYNNRTWLLEKILGEGGHDAINKYFSEKAAAEDRRREAERKRREEEARREALRKRIEEEARREAERKRKAEEARREAERKRKEEIKKIMKLYERKRSDAAAEEEEEEEEEKIDMVDGDGLFGDDDGADY